MVPEGRSSLPKLKYALISLLHSSRLKFMFSIYSSPKFWSFSAKSCISSSCRYSTSLLTIIKDSWRNLNFVLLAVSSINCFICIFFLSYKPSLSARFLLRVLTFSTTPCPCIRCWSCYLYLLGGHNASLDLKPYWGSPILLSLFMLVLFLNSR